MSLIRLIESFQQVKAHVSRASATIIEDFVDEAPAEPPILLDGLTLTTAYRVSYVAEGTNVKIPIPATSTSESNGESSLIVQGNGGLERSTTRFDARLTPWVAL